MSRVGEEYERAVYDFVKKLDPSAEVIFDHKVPDRETGDLRQCDVWVNAKFGGLYPYSIYVSCKDHGRKFDISDVDAFEGEMRSRQANKGVIYSKIGFTRSALAKAKKLNIACCRIYHNQPADEPMSNFFTNFAFCPSMSLECKEKPLDETINYWKDIFNIKTSNGTVIEVIEREFVNWENFVVEKAKLDNSFPLNFTKEMNFTNSSGISIKITMRGWWRVFVARKDTTLFTGSYVETENALRGSFTGPVIDTQSSNPGPDWILYLGDINKFSGNRLSVILAKANIKDQINEAYSGLPLLTDDHGNTQQ